MAIKKLSPVKKKSAIKAKAAKAKVAPAPVEATTALTIVLKGEVVTTNFAEWKTGLLARIKDADRDLKTDEDFAIAEVAVRELKAAEKALTEAKASALAQAEAITALFVGIDEISVECQRARLNLERQRKSKMEEVKQTMVAEAIDKVSKHLEEQNEDFKPGYTTVYALAEFPAAIKGKKSFETMQVALDLLVADICRRVDTEAARIAANRATIDEIEPEHRPLFQDERHLLGLLAEELEQEIGRRIATAIEAEAEALRKAAEAPKKTAEENEREEIEEAAQDPFVPPPKPFINPNPTQPRGFASKSQEKRINAQKGEDYRITISLKVGRDEAIRWCRTVNGWVTDSEIPGGAVKLGRVKK